MAETFAGDWRNLPQLQSEQGECDPWLWGRASANFYNSTIMHGQGVGYVLDAMAERYKWHWFNYTRQSDINSKCVIPQSHQTVCSIPHYQHSCDVIQWEHCPLEQRSASGCGDFDEVRSCGRRSIVLSQCSYITASSWQDMSLGQLPWKLTHFSRSEGHVAVPLAVDYSQMPMWQEGIPTMIAPHRLVWPVWGPYAFVPEARWLHHVEHGSLAILYHQCVSRQDVDTLEQYARSFNKNLSSIIPERHLGGTPFRWMLSPYPNLKSKFAFVLYATQSLYECYDAARMTRAIVTDYGCPRYQCERKMTGNGAYAYLLQDELEYDIIDDSSLGAINRVALLPPYALLLAGLMAFLLLTSFRKGRKSLF